MLDTKIVNGTVIDGTGAPGVRADVGIAGGVVRELGDDVGRAKRVVDATDLVVAPGVIDVHTHYDAQLAWDPLATPSSTHGVTTVIAGNCGFGLAPVRPDDAGYLTRLMSRVEGIPLEALEGSLEWTWETFAEWRRTIEGRTAVNVGVLASHSTIRRYVMGERASSDAATAAEVETMAAELRHALAAGALGFSTSRAPGHADAEQRPVPSRSATDAEILRLCDVVGEFPRGNLEVVLRGSVEGFSTEEVALLAEMSRRGGCQVNWNLLTVDSGRRDLLHEQLSASDAARELGGTVLALVLPQPLRLAVDFDNGFTLDMLPGWRDRFFAKSHDERLAVLGDDRARGALCAAAEAGASGVLRRFCDWGEYTVVEAPGAPDSSIAGASGNELARRWGCSAFDALARVALETRLRAVFYPPTVGADEASWQLRGEALLDDRTIVGGSDAGAHVDVMCGASYPTEMLGACVRDRGLLSLEEAVRQLTSVPADAYRLGSRGRIGEESAADLMVFDPSTVTAGDIVTVRDLPAGASRFVAPSRGVVSVMVGGVEIARDGEVTGDHGGRWIDQSAGATGELA